MLLWTLGCMYLFKFVGFFLNIYPGVELLDYMIVLFLGFWETSILFSTFYIPTNSIWAFPFLHILANICYLCYVSWWPFWQVWGGISLWFWFVFPWWLAMLSIFSCASWLPAFPLWKNAYSVLLLIFNQFFFYVELYELFVYVGY